MRTRTTAISLLTEPQRTKFRQVFADLLASSTMTEDEAREARQLHWKGDRLCLADLSALFGSLVKVDDFDPVVIAQFHAAFFNLGIEGTPGREYSPAVYFHVPNELKIQVESFVEQNFCATEVGWETDGSLRVWWD